MLIARLRHIVQMRTPPHISISIRFALSRKKRKHPTRNNFLGTKNLYCSEALDLSRPPPLIVNVKRILAQGGIVLIQNRCYKKTQAYWYFLEWVCWVLPWRMWKKGGVERERYDGVIYPTVDLVTIPIDIDKGCVIVCQHLGGNVCDWAS